MTRVAPRCAQVAAQHVRLERCDAGNYHVTALASPPRAWLNGRQLSAGRASMVAPGDELELGERGVAATAFRVKMVHASVWQQLGADGGEGVNGAASANGNGAHHAAASKERSLV